MSPFDYPEINELFNKLLDNLLSESGRGALLIATSHVDEHLTRLIEAALPKSLSKNHKDKLFKYPGPLSSFSAKIELSYAFRLIDQNFYNSLNALKKLRNEAAHSSRSFELFELNERMKAVYDLGPAVPSVVREIGIKMMLESKFASIKRMFERHKLDEQSQQRVMEGILNDEQKMKSLERESPFWELLYGLCLICGFIVYEREKISSLTENINTWSDILGNAKLVNDKKA
jgi:DNA-binding MltR family transcriptional regulator